MKEIYVFVETVEAGIVRLDAVKPARGTIFLPEAELPFPVREGMWLKISFEIAAEAQEKARKRIIHLQKILQQKDKNNE